MKKLILLSLILALELSACGGKTSGSSTTSLPKTLTTSASESPTRIVTEFLEALKTGDFESAYDRIFTPFTDKEGYAYRMRDLVQKYNSTLLSYRVVGTQILGDKAIVVVELEVSFKTPNSNEGVSRRTVTNQYDLATIEDDWKITSDKCIRNCVNPQEPKAEEPKVPQ